MCVELYPNVGTRKARLYGARINDTWAVGKIDPVTSSISILSKTRVEGLEHLEPGPIEDNKSGDKLLREWVTCSEIAQLPRYADRAGHLPWLFKHTLTGLYEVEGSAQAGSTIYLITPDMYNDARNADTQAIVGANHKRRIRYIYLTTNADRDSRLHSAEVMEALPNGPRYLPYT